MGAHALLAGVKQVEGHQPLVERDMATLHDGPGRDGEILAAFLLSAAIPARLFRLVGVVDNPAMAANRPFRPAQVFKPFPGVFRGLEMGGYKGVRHGRISSKSEEILALGPCGVKSIIRNLVLDTSSPFPLHIQSIRSLRTPAGDSGWQERKRFPRAWPHQRAPGRLRRIRPSGTTTGTARQLAGLNGQARCG